MAHRTLVTDFLAAVRLQANGPVEDLFEKLGDTHFNLIVFGQPFPLENQRR